ncbi:phosphoserine aminotransferase apoenzyme [Catalinimonas alkaloidigena]|uniref:Phosphoserine aminotransferase apoenzyme n=1 Tax=Catalinimonas alkaloidigena TaxID=1075417 RepID=A0A1G9HIN2_9BACT|nr:aminotransferase class V-fold PLP-dependent enzyme [Catalinimonas alkaloidigena]SDL12749.1 phosphoserine aminotransferase apoenzyme [Catalinimonas alkaloidigena]
MITFFPGPSKVYDRISEYLQDAFQEGVLSISHRSTAFNELSRRAIEATKAKLHIPDDYTLMYTSSSSEGWEIVAQSLIREKSLHLYSGSFGERGFQYTNYLHEGALPYVLDVNEAIPVQDLPVDDSTELIACVQNETSNGTQTSVDTIRALRDAYPQALISVDATSAMAGIATDYTAADIWHASVQKCFGMPAGLGLLVCSPRAVAKAEEIGEKRHYNSLLTILKNIEKWQTNTTPNVLGIYLLMRVMETAPDIAEVDAQLKRRAAQLYAMAEQLPHYQPLVTNHAVRSQTVVTVKTDATRLAATKDAAKAEGLLLGNGYGEWKDSTFRIANFPALLDSEVAQLVDFLTAYANRPA